MEWIQYNNPPHSKTMFSMVFQQQHFFLEYLYHNNWTVCKLLPMLVHACPHMSLPICVCSHSFVFISACLHSSVLVLTCSFLFMLMLTCWVLLTCSCSQPFTHPHWSLPILTLLLFAVVHSLVPTHLGQPLPPS